MAKKRTKKSTDKRKVSNVHKNEPIDVTSMDLERLKDRAADLPSLIEYAHSVGGFAIVPTEQGVIKGNAMNAMKEQTQEKMDMILEQMRVLAKQANELKTRVEISQEIYDASISFEPVMGKTYYLYEKEDQTRILSLIAPDEWGQNAGFKRPIATVKLQYDHTWKVEEKFEDKDNL